MGAGKDPLGEVERLIDELEAFAERPSPFWKPNHILVRDEDFFRVTHRLRESLPSELSESRAVLEKRDLILKNAQEEHRRIMETAEKRLDDLVSEEQVVIAAQREAERIIERARLQGEEMRRDALLYTAELLEDMEKQFNATLSTIKKGRQFIETEINKEVSTNMADVDPPAAGAPAEVSK
jgi:cell division septum initiation protein DivIVA